MDVNEVLLPGVGLRYEFTDHKGDTIAVVARRGGDFDVVVYTREDPDQARPLLCLTDEEAEAMAQILGAPRIAERFIEPAREIPGLKTGQVHVLAGSPFADHPLGTPTRAPAPGPRLSRSCATRGCWPRRGPPRCCAPRTS